jgi:peptidyl-prolyl cis-trans isomerase C
MGSQRINICAAIAALSLALAGCGGGGEIEETSQEDALAVIKGVPLTSVDIDARLATMPPETREEFNNPSSLSAVIDREVRTRVLAQAAEDEGFLESEEFRATLDGARTLILAELYSRKIQEDALRISEDDLREAYERDKHVYSSNTVTKARHILCASVEQANAALESVRGGMAFEQAVSRYSIDNYTKSKSGDLGSLTRDTVIPGLGVSPEFVDALAGIEVGGVGGPLQTRSGFHIVQVLSRVEGVVPPFTEVRGLLARRLEKERSETGLTTIMERLWDKYDVTVNPNAIKKYIGFPVTPEEFMRHLSEATSSGDKITLCTEMADQFPDNKYAPYMMFTKGFVYSEELHNYQEAELTFRSLLQKYPNSNYAAAARWMIQNMRGEHPPFRNVEDVLNLAKSP